METPTERPGLTAAIARIADDDIRRDMDLGRTAKIALYFSARVAKRLRFAYQVHALLVDEGVMEDRDMSPEFAVRVIADLIHSSRKVAS